MSGYPNKKELLETIRSTIQTDWNKTGLSTDYRDYNMAALVRENFTYRPSYGWYVTDLGPEAFVASLHRNLKRKKVSA